MMTLYDRVTGTSLYLVTRIANRTCRFQWRGLGYAEEAFTSGRPVVATCWHGMTMLVVSLACSLFDISKVAVIMPDDWRGGTLSVFAEKLGARAFPLNLGGDTTLGMARNLSKFVRKVAGGMHCLIAPDGPDGPAYVPKAGVTYMARKAGAMILPVGAYARHAYRVPRWDRYYVPYPFTRISVQAGEPFTVSQDVRDLSDVNEHLRNVLHQVEAQAAANYYEQEWDQARLPDPLMV